MIKNFEDFVNEGYFVADNSMRRELSKHQYLESTDSELLNIDHANVGFLLIDHAYYSIENEETDEEYQEDVKEFIDKYKKSIYKFTPVEIADEFLGFFGNRNMEKFLSSKGVSEKDIDNIIIRLRRKMVDNHWNVKDMNSFTYGFDMSLEHYLEIKGIKSNSNFDYKLYISRVEYLLKQLGLNDQEIKEYIYGK